MIGRIKTGKSFRGCITYVLNDKLKQDHDRKPVMKDRAEVLCFNFCGGKEKELIGQFNEVRQLNPKLSKPMLHLSLSLDVNDKLAQYQKIELVEDCARELGFDKHQYLAVEHKDTEHPHLHIVINRVGFDGKTLSDSNNFKHMANMCRKMELKYNLRQVMNPKKYMHPSQRNVPRLNKRQEQLKSDIKKYLLSSNNYREFEKKMKRLNYEVIKGRGIAFRDTKNVYTKGSEVGFSLPTIEKILKLKPDQKLELLDKNEYINQLEIRALRKETWSEKPQRSSLMYEPGSNSINPELLEDDEERKPRHRHRHH